MAFPTSLGSIKAMNPPLSSTFGKMNSFGWKGNRRTRRASQPSLTYWACIKSYFDDTLLHGYRYVTEAGRGVYERALWLTVLLAMICSMSYIVTDYYMRFINAPTATSQQATRVPISDIPFPSVVVCPASRLNKSAVTELATEIFEFQSKRQYSVKSSVEDIITELMFFGSFYTMEIELDDFYVLDQLHNVLQDMHNGSYNIEHLVDRLTPDCRMFLNKCQFAANEQNCSAMFHRRQTEIGMCCAFNMNRPTEEQFWKGQIYNRSDQLYVKTSGLEVGLTVELNPHLEEIAYVLQSNIGFRVFIVEPHNYPSEDDQPIIIGPNYEAFLSVLPKKVTGDPAMVDISAESRGCFFFSEPTLIYNNFYTFQECNTVCKVKDIISYCGCTPIQYGNYFNTTRCTIIDLSCLANWKRKWYSSVPVFSETSTRTDSRFFRCPECLPICNYIIYNVQTSLGFIAPTNLNVTTFAGIRDINFNRGIGILHVYFGNSYVTEFKQTIIHTWYELLSIFGGLVGIVIGGSLISIAELLWFATGKLSLIWWRRNRVAITDPNWVFHTNRRKSKALDEAIKKNEQGIVYWEEFKQYVE